MNVAPWGVQGLLAATFHLSRGEASRVPANAVLLVLAAFVVIGRWVIVPA
jgi:putative oxidoreductase